MFVLGRIFPSILGEMTTDSEVVEFETFFQTHPCIGAERSIQQSSETVRMRVERLEREGQLVKQWLQQHQL